MGLNADTGMQDNRLVVAAFDALESEIAVLDGTGEILRVIRGMARGGHFAVAFGPAGVRYRLVLPIEQS